MARHLSGDWACSRALGLKWFLWLAILQAPLLGICSGYSASCHIRISFHRLELLYHSSGCIIFDCLSPASTHSLRSSFHCRAGLSFFSRHPSSSVMCIVSSLLHSRSTMAARSGLLSRSRVFSISSWPFSQTKESNLVHRDLIVICAGLFSCRLHNGARGHNIGSQTSSLSVAIFAN